MFKRLFALILTFTLIFVSVPSMQADASDINISINGHNVNFNQSSGLPFVDSANRTQVPFRVTMEQYGATVSWDQGNQIAIAEKDGIVVKVPIGQAYIYKNNELIANDTAALIKDNKTYLPIRAVLEAFGANVSWQASTHTVFVSTDGQGNLMTIHFIDVGQGDSIFIDFDDYEILVDAGSNSYGSKVVGYISPYVDGDLELVIGTHVHEDHIGGLDSVLNSFQIDEIIDSGDTGTTVTYKDYHAAVLNEANCNYFSDIDMSIDLGGGATLKIIETGDGDSNVNNNSVITLLDYNDIEVLLTGDMESSTEKNNLSKFSDVEVLKAGHHGSNTASCQEFLNVIKPETVIVSCGLGNSYGHPHKESMTRFLNMGVTVYGTYESGSIVMTTEGNSYSLNTSTKLTLEDANATAPEDNTVIPNTNTVPANDTQNSVVIQNEASYIGNSNTMKFHSPSCSSVSTISSQNVVYIKLRADAISKGYVPCKRCNP